MWEEEKLQSNQWNCMIENLKMVAVLNLSVAELLTKAFDF